MVEHSSVGPFGFGDLWQDGHLVIGTMGGFSQWAATDWYTTQCGPA
jgi:hypothetical protein